MRRGVEILFFMMNQSSQLTKNFFSARIFLTEDKDVGMRRAVSSVFYEGTKTRIIF